MNEQEVMMHVFTKYFGKTEDEIRETMYEDDGEGNSVLKEGVADVLLNMDESRINRIKEEVGATATKKFDEGYKKAQKEVLTKFEKDLKEKYGIDTDKNGLELIEELTKEMSKGGDFTEETIKTHPLYLKLEGQKKAEFDEKIEELNREFNDFKNGVERNRELSSVKSLARQEFLALNPVLSEDKAKAERQVEMFLKQLEEYGYMPQDGTYIVTRGDSRLEDSHGNPIPFSGFVKSKADEMFDFKVQDPRQSPGNTPTGNAGARKKMPKEEYNKLVAQYEKERNWEKMKELGNYEVV